MIIQCQPCNGKTSLSMSIPTPYINRLLVFYIQLSEFPNFYTCSGWKHTLNTNNNSSYTVCKLSIRTLIQDLIIKKSIDFSCHEIDLVLIFIRHLHLSYHTLRKRCLMWNLLIKFLITYLGTLFDPISWFIIDLNR